MATLDELFEEMRRQVAQDEKRRQKKQRPQLIAPDKPLTEAELKARDVTPSIDK